VENALNVDTRAIDANAIRDVCLDDFQTRITSMLSQIRPPPNREIIKYTDVSALCDQTVNQMTTNETATPGNQIDAHGLFCSIPAVLPIANRRTPAVRVQNPPRDRGGRPLAAGPSVHYLSPWYLTALPLFNSGTIDASRR
jgi:hypothetical protein